MIFDLHFYQILECHTIKRGVIPVREITGKSPEQVKYAYMVSFALFTNAILLLYYSRWCE